MSCFDFHRRVYFSREQLITCPFGQLCPCVNYIVPLSDGGKIFYSLNIAYQEKIHCYWRVVKNACLVMCIRGKFDGLNSMAAISLKTLLNHFRRYEDAFVVFF